MISRPVVLALLAAACVSAAAGGAYLAVRHIGAASSVPAPTVSAAQPTSGQPVAETEALISPPTAGKVEAVQVDAEASKVEADKALRSTTSPARTPQSTASAKKQAPAVNRVSQSASSAQASRSAAQNAPDQSLAVERPSPTRESPATPAPAIPAPPVQPEPVSTEPPPPAKPQFVEVVIPASSVVGIQVENSITSETAKVEDRVEARVTRDVTGEGRLAIPAGTKVIGDVVLVERGGKMKDKARLGVRFHTLVLADGRHVAFRTDSIFREGSSPGAESARKIGGAAVGGAILGAILGGAKGAAIGGATGAAGGGAVVMAGDRNAATLPAGTILTVRLAAPVSVDVEKEM
jgi:hypothetical protein